MKKKILFAFLKEDCPLFSRALIAPWRLCLLAAGLALLCVGSHVTPWTGITRFRSSWASAH